MLQTVKGSSAVVGDVFKHTYNGKTYEVVKNVVGDIIFLHLVGGESYSGYHLLYNDLDDVIIAEEFFGIDLS